MRNYREHLISETSTIKEALVKLDKLAADAIVFAVDDDNRLVGSLTDGDVRRGLIRGNNISDQVSVLVQQAPKYLLKNNYSVEDVIALRKGDFNIIPLLDDDRKVIDIINFRFHNSYLPVDAVIMAGGRGSRLQPLTNEVPKPLLNVGDKPIIDHNFDRLRKFGIDNFWISVNYMGEMLEDHFGDGSERQAKVQYVWEDEPLGTIGAVSKIENFEQDVVLVTNSDVLTTMNYEDFYLDFIAKDADMSVATIPFKVDVPYAVMETSNEHVISFREKPTYTYYSNGGIYLIKRSILDRIPANTFYNSTDLMESLLASNNKLISFPLRGYWLDIGKMEDFKKAQNDIQHLDM